MLISKAPLPTCGLLVAWNYLEANRYVSFQLAAGSGTPMNKHHHTIIQIG